MNHAWETEIRKSPLLGCNLKKEQKYQMQRGLT